ncbi:MAG: matrixin family metalloprotease [Terriglobia bacterium]|jgi:predicted Zn-dependent protease
MRQVMLGLLLMLMVGPARAVDREAAKGFFRQGNGLYDQDRFRESAAAYTQALEQDPQFIEAYYNRALANEMVDRQKAIGDFRRFVELATDDPGRKYQVAQARARLQILENLPVYPEALQPSHYVPAAGDYYWQVAATSESEKWTTFPIKVSLGSVSVLNWGQGAREAFNIWKEMFPLELVAAPERADIRVEWESSPIGEGHAGEEADWVQIRRVGGELTGRKVAFITVDLSRRWSKDEMRAIILHEMGHALGIKGHSESKGDVMYFQIQEKPHQVVVPVVPYPVFWKSLVSKPSPRDLNTLIRLYNTPGAVVRLE